MFYCDCILGLFSIADDSEPNSRASSPPSLEELDCLANHHVTLMSLACIHPNIFDPMAPGQLNITNPLPCGDERDEPAILSIENINFDITK